MTSLMQLLFKLNRPFEVASRGYSFIISFSGALALHEVLAFSFYGVCYLLILFTLCSMSPFEFLYIGFSQSMLPFCMREVWVITACLALIDATASHYKDGLAAADVEKEFYRVQGELYTLCRTKVVLHFLKN